MPISLPDIYLSYAIPVLVALLLGVLFPVAGHITDRPQRRQYYTLQLITFLSAIVGAKLIFLFGEYNWPLQSVENWQAVLYSGRSILGALIFGFLAAELAKPLMAYSLPPNDKFAAMLPFTIAIGRIGCLLSGCCRGCPTNSSLAIAYGDGIARHPVQIYEMIFHITAGVVAIVLVRHKWFRGNVFTLYLIEYGIFRFLIEFIRETPRIYADLSAYQWLALLMLALGMVFLLKRTFMPSRMWKAHYGIDKELNRSPETIGNSHA